MNGVILQNGKPMSDLRLTEPASKFTIAPGVVLPPTQADLPYDDGIPMETQRHKFQLDLLLDVLQPWLDSRSDGYIGGNMFVYHNMAQIWHRNFRGPDFFAVLGVPKGERLSWVVWEEGKAPDVVIEILSENTAEKDKNDRKSNYQNQMRVTEYFWFDPFNPEDWAGFALHQGIYQPILPRADNLLPSRVMELGLQLWQGNYKGIDATWLRWCTLDGELLPTAQELASAERQRVEQEQLRVKQTRLRLQHVVRKLLQEGMSIARVVEITGLSATQVTRLAEHATTRAKNLDRK